MTGYLARAAEWYRGGKWSPVVVAAYAGLIGLFVWAVLQFYLPGQGFSYFIAFGSLQEPGMLDEVRQQKPYIQPESPGYDAQYYAQLAMHPTLRDPRLKEAVDNLPYRGRRIFFAATAYVLGLGKPGWILQVYALQNVFCWILLAGLLLHWFPPRSWDDFLRWAGVLFSAGMCQSVHNALVDGPSLLLIAWAVYLLERGRPWWSALVMGLAGLGKETNLLGGIALLPAGQTGWRARARTGAQVALVALPLAIWLVRLRFLTTGMEGFGDGNFALPFVGYSHKWQEVFSTPAHSFSSAPRLIVIGLTVQFLFLLLHRSWQNPWWRIGMMFALLLIFLGDAVWEGDPGASARVLLPMQLGFNILVPRGRWWLAILVLGNISALAAKEVFDSPAHEVCHVSGPGNLLFEHGRKELTMTLGPEWSKAERKNDRFWSWASGAAHVAIQNPHGAGLECDLDLEVGAADQRHLHVLLNDREIWLGEIGKKVVHFTLTGLSLRPGTNELRFFTDEPPTHRDPDPRPLAFSLFDAKLELRRLDAAPKQSE